MIVMPPMTAPQEASWLGLLDLGERLPSNWTLVGGQMVHLHCAELGFSARRTTTDVDAVLDVVDKPTILLEFTRVLADIGFDLAGETATGRQHRWVRGDASIDVLVPNGIGQRAASRTGVAGGPTVQTPGGKQALRRSERVEVEVAGRVGSVRRPNLAGALIVKAAAHSIPVDPAKGRHRSDFATLATMVSRGTFADDGLSGREKNYLIGMVTAVLADPIATDGSEEIIDGLRRLQMLVT